MADLILCRPVPPKSLLWHVENEPMEGAMVAISLRVATLHTPGGMSLIPLGL